LAFWADYWKSLKPLEVEEPVDVWIHRPLAYVLARALLPTPISPNLVTFGSIFLGLGAGALLVIERPWHLQLGGLCLFLSAVFDCADGQLARLRKTSSQFGRMLDGTADLIVIVASVGGATWHIWQRYAEPLWLGLFFLGATAVTVVTGSFHTGLYDHFKNVYLRFTSPTFKEGEDYESALERYRERPREEFGPFARFVAWPTYLFYVKSQSDVARDFDPYAPRRLSTLPPYDDARAAIYRRNMSPIMRIWRSWFGLGSLVFGLSVAAVLDVLEWYMIGRCVALNAVFYGYLRPTQRRASRRAAEEMGLPVAERPTEV
jgi:hypothetical protein